MGIQLVSITFMDREPLAENPADRHMQVKYYVLNDDGSVREIRTEGSDAPESIKDAIHALFTEAVTKAIEGADAREEEELIKQKVAVEERLRQLKAKGT